MYREELKKHISIGQTEEWEFSSDNEYYFAIGILMQYYNQLMKNKNISAGRERMALTAKNDKELKNVLVGTFKKVNHLIEFKNERHNCLMSHVTVYNPTDKINYDVILSGLTETNKSVLI